MGKVYSSVDIIKVLTADGWFLYDVVGDHHQFKHPTRPGRVTVTHPKKELSKSVVASISRQSGIKF